MSYNAHPGDCVKVTTTKITQCFAHVKFQKGGEKYSGTLHISEFKKLGYKYIESLFEIIKIGDEFDATLIEYNDKYHSWRLSLVISQTDLN